MAEALFLTVPISWRGTLQQYVGRLHRLHENKLLVQVYDYVDTSVPVLNRMYAKRLEAYKAVGYTVAWSGEPEAQADLKFAAIERIAVQAAIAFEEARGCKVESGESDTCGVDLISRRKVSDKLARENRNSIYRGKRTSRSWRDSTYCKRIQNGATPRR